MDTFRVIGLYLELGTVLLLAGAAIAALVRGTTRPGRWLAVSMLVALAGVVGLVILDATPHDVSSATFGGALANASFALFPALIYGFGREFHTNDRWTDTLAWVGATSLVAVSIAMPVAARFLEPRDWWHDALQVTIGVFALVLLGITSSDLARAGSASRSPLVHERLKLFSSSIVGIMLAYVVSAIPTALTAALLGYVVAGAGVVMLVAYAPPSGLRAIWRRSLLAQMDGVVQHLMVADSRDEVTRESMPLILDLTGARQVELLDEDGTVVAVHRSSAVTRGEHDEPPIVSTFPFGALSVVPDPYAPVFRTDELHLVRLLGAYIGLALARCDALDDERRTARRLAVADRLKDALMAAASHDLRTPLATIIGLADTLAEHPGSLVRPEAPTYLRRIAIAGRRLRGMLDDLLDLRRFDTLTTGIDHGPVDLLELAERVVGQFEPQHVVVSTSGSPVIVDCDPSLIERVVENLIANADKYVGDGGHVEVVVTGHDGYAKLVVDDDGPGIPPDQREYVFEPFLRGRGTKASGSGLGLSIVRRFVELHGGRAWVEESPAGGARFCVELPLAYSTVQMEAVVVR